MPSPDPSEDENFSSEGPSGEPASPTGASSGTGASNGTGTSSEDPASADTPGTDTPGAGADASASGADVSEMSASTGEDREGKNAVDEGSSADEDLPDQEKTEQSDGGKAHVNSSGDSSSSDSSSSDSSSGGDPSAVECVNCGHSFTGNYCPRCGQEVDPSVSVIGVIGGFFREFIDLESGLWPTMVGLTVRPGTVLRRYLSGVRAGLIDPGRYLLAAVVVDYGATRFLAWTGVTKPLARSDFSFSSSGTGEGIGKVFEATFEQVGTLSISMRSEASALSFLLIAGLLSALLYRLFESEFEQTGEALATGSYLAAHAAFLALGAELLSLPPMALQAGEPVEAGLFINLSIFVIFVGYVGFASHEGFGPGWRPALRGTFAAIWAALELISVAFTTMTVYATGLALTRPDRYVPAGETSLTVGVALSVTALIGAIPLLLHAVVELYHRVR